MTSISTNNNQPQRSDKLIGIGACLLNQNSPEELALLTPIQLSWYCFQHAFSNFDIVPGNIEMLDDYMNEFKPEDDTPDHRKIARFKLKEYFCSEPTLKTMSMGQLWLHVMEEYKKTPEYNSDSAITERKKRERANKLTNLEKNTEATAKANNDWREAIKARNVQFEIWKVQRKDLLARHAEELRLFSEARTTAETDWDNYVSYLREMFRTIKNQ